ncbi:unnamed protein product [Callosobruchus maculatus]|uniref:PX domain-containing protein kinase-like protein n=1 Tax=Callosobruchus maculatus TaxID=64391 RepID=A0A653CNT7_CALMS|nr:unnamed protein product [Callosobruchus maculatus]
MSEERDPLDLDAEALMNEKADNIEFVVDDSDEENHESEPEGDPEPGGVEDITILVESDDDSRGDLKPDDENSSQHSSYIDDYPDLEEVSTDQIKGSSKQISESTGKGIKRPRDSDNENSTSKKVSIHGEDTCPKLTTNPCFVPGCQLPKNKKVYFFRVPKNKILFQLWDLMIKRPGVRLTGQCLVCQQHFHKDDILKVEGPRESGGRLLALKREALPCISYVQRCPVINCGLRAGRSQQFPILDKNNFSVWLERLGNPKLKFADILQILRYRVCDGHFHKKCFDENGELKSGSTPSVNIPEFPHVAYMSYPSARDLVKLPTPPLTGKCAFEKCADKAKKKQNVYPLPTNFENLVKWLAASGHPNWIATTLEKTLERVNQQVSVGFGVCLDHFTSYDFVDASLEQLANTAVPTRKGDQEPSINYAVEVKSVVPVKPGTAPPAISPAPVSAVNNNNMVILLPSNPAPVAPSIAPVSVVVPVNPAPQQTVSANVPNPIQPVLPAPPPPTNMVPLLVSNNGDTKWVAIARCPCCTSETPNSEPNINQVMLVPQEVITATNPDFLQKMLSAAVSGGQPQPAAAPSRFTEPTFLPKATPTVPKVTNNLPRIPTPKVTPSMRRTAAANITPTDTIDLTETSEKDDSNVQNELPKTSQSPAHDQFCCYNKRGCCYVGCIAEPSATNPLYTFPVDVERRKAWLQACGRTDAIYYKWLQVCKMHFTPDCFHEKGFLLPDAVPVQNQYKAPLTCSQPGSHKFHSSSNKNQQEFTIKVYRGPYSNEIWKVNRRYNDFHKLHSVLLTSGIPLELPPKKLIGNMDPHFINERQQGLQKYLDSIFMNPILASSLPARSFVDPANYCQPFGEVALQHVSLALRGEQGWEVVGPIPDIGWRLRKHYFQLRCKSMPKEEILGAWTDYGPDRYLDDRDMGATFKSIGQLQHPYIHSTDLSLCTDTGALVARVYNKEGSLRDYLCTAKPKQSFLKKYGNPKIGHRGLSVEQVALYGRQILEALKFLHDKGFPYGHLSTGNIMIENDRIKLLDIENGVLGVPSFYRPYFIQHKRINTMQAVDVYCLGHVLYEMTFGVPLRESIVDDIPECPIKNILERILSPEACRNGLPTVADLLAEPLFALTVLKLYPGEKAHFKLSTQLKDHLRTSIEKMEARLREEQRLVRGQKRLARLQEMMSVEEEEKRKHKNKKQERRDQQQQLHNQKQKASVEKTNSISGDRSDSVNSSTTPSVGTSTPPSASGSNIPSPPPPPPPMDGLPPPPPPMGAAPPVTSPPPTSETADEKRTALLNDICEFNKAQLRKIKPGCGVKTKSRKTKVS